VRRGEFVAVIGGTGRHVVCCVTSPANAVCGVVAMLVMDCFPCFFVTWRVLFSGKSSLLAGLLGETGFSGTKSVVGSLGYVPQLGTFVLLPTIPTPDTRAPVLFIEAVGSVLVWLVVSCLGGGAAWIYNATVRDNILFGLPWDEAKYERTISLSCLETDLGQFAAGDLTEIGEKGINLSGGQKQRISIARAVYSDSDILFLDGKGHSVHGMRVLVTARALTLW
jgi:hypothetical protein